jgi:hypothetical protein
MHNVFNLLSRGCPKGEPEVRNVSLYGGVAGSARSPLHHPFLTPLAEGGSAKPEESCIASASALALLAIQRSNHDCRTTALYFTHNYVFKTVLRRSGSIWGINRAVPDYFLDPSRRVQEFCNRKEIRLAATNGNPAPPRAFPRRCRG